MALILLPAPLTLTPSPLSIPFLTDRQVKQSARMERSRMCALHASELREKDEQLVRFQGDLETLVYSLRQWQHAVTVNASPATGSSSSQSVGAAGVGAMGVGVGASVEALSGRMSVAGGQLPCFLSSYLPSFRPSLLPTFHLTNTFSCCCCC